MLVDFGIAKASSGHTTVGAQGYTPGYAPPEQYGDAVTGPYSDQYSFAATLYALLTGSPPPESVDIMLGDKPCPPLGCMRKNIPLHVDNAIRKPCPLSPICASPSVEEFFTALTDPAALADVTLMPGTDTIEAFPNRPPLPNPLTVPAPLPAPPKRAQPLAVDRPVGCRRGS